MTETEVRDTGPSDEDLLDANERLGTALTYIGMELGLPRPTPHYTWGVRDVQALATEVWTEHLHYQSLRTALLMLLADGPLAVGATTTIYGPGDQSIVDKVRELVAPGMAPGAPYRPIDTRDWHELVTLPMAHGVPPVVAIPRDWSVMPVGPADNPLFNTDYRSPG